MGKKTGDIAKLIVDNFASVKRGESVLILAEVETPNSIKSAFLTAAQSAAGDDVSMAIYKNRAPYTHPPKPLPIVVKQADVVICLDIYLSHTELEKEARAAGTRFLNMHPASYATLMRAVIGVDYDIMRKRGEKLAGVLSSAKKCKITSPIGTVLELEFDSDKNIYLGHGMPREKGDYETLPNGKVKIPTVLDSINGVFVVNGVIIPPVNELKETVKLTFEKGWVVKIEGGSQAEQYSRFLESFKDPSMYCFDHLTLGFNPKASLVQPKPPAFSSEAEKVMGCVNIGLGRAGLKGKQHTDVVAVGAIVEVDGNTLIKNGRYTLFE